MWESLFLPVLNILLENMTLNPPRVCLFSSICFAQFREHLTLSLSFLMHLSLLICCSLFNSTFFILKKELFFVFIANKKKINGICSWNNSKVFQNFGQKNRCRAQFYLDWSILIPKRQNMENWGVAWCNGYHLCLPIGRSAVRI